MLGMKVFNKSIENLNLVSKTIDLDVKDLKKGIYILRINELNTFSAQKIIIE